MQEGRPVLLTVSAQQPAFIGGTETFLRELSRQIGERGWDSVICFNESPKGPVEDFLKLPNITIDRWDVRKIRFSASFEFSRILRKYRPEIIHFHYGPFIAPYPWIAKLHGARRIIFTDHGSRPELFIAHRAPVWKRLAAGAINYPVDNVVAVSDHVQRCARELSIFPREKLFRIYNSVDTTRVVQDPSVAAGFRRRYRIPQDRVLFTQVSWMIPEKGITDFLQAARTATARNSRVHFAVVGDGPLLPEHRDSATQLGLADRVTFTGLIEDPFSAGVFAATDVLCQCSRWQEAFGWSMTEAMAHGKPVIATRVGGIPEVVADGLTGYLVERRNHSALAERMVELANDPALRARMGAAGRNRVAEQFEVASNVAKLVALYGIAPAACAKEKYVTAGERS